MSEAVKQIEGVQSVEVSLNQGLARITLKPGNGVSLESIREAVVHNGFTPREARVRVQGRLFSADGKPQLRVSGLEQTYQLVLSGESKALRRDLEERMGKVVLLEGVIPVPPKTGPSHILQVSRIQEAP